MSSGPAHSAAVFLTLCPGLRDWCPLPYLVYPVQLVHFHVAMPSQVQAQSCLRVLPLPGRLSPHLPVAFLSLWSLLDHRPTSPRPLCCILLLCSQIKNTCPLHHHGECGYHL